MKSIDEDLPAALSVHALHRCSVDVVVIFASMAERAAAR